MELAAVTASSSGMGSEPLFPTPGPSAEPDVAADPPSPDYRPVSPDYAPESPPAPEKRKRIPWTKRPPASTITVPVLMHAYRFMLRPWMVYVLCGQRVAAATWHDMGWPGWVSPISWRPNLAPKAPCTLLPVTAVKRFFGSAAGDE